jgi:hypothetical protein
VGSRHRWKNNIRMDRKVLGCGGVVELMWLGIATRGELNFEFQTCSDSLH